MPKWFAKVPWRVIGEAVFAWYQQTQAKKAAAAAAAAAAKKES